MSEQDYIGVRDKYVPNESKVADAIDAQMRRTSNEPFVAPLDDYVPGEELTPLSSASSSYVEAEADSVVSTINSLISRNGTNELTLVEMTSRINAILRVLVEAELIPMESED